MTLGGASDGWRRLRAKVESRVMYIALFHVLACAADSDLPETDAAHSGASVTDAGNGGAGTDASGASDTGTSGIPRLDGSAPIPPVRDSDTGAARPDAANVEGGPAATDAATGTDGSNSTDPPGVACNPADKKPDPVKASFTQIGKYESLTKEPTTGPEKPVLESDPGLPEWTVYRPENLGSGGKHPILVWANGGCLTNGTLYGEFLLEAASHGFIAIADGKPLAAGASPGSGGMRGGGGADGKPLQLAIDWIVAENERPCSQYYHKLDATKVAVSGQSCGGVMAMYAAQDKRVTTAIINNSGLFSRNASLYAKLHGPMAFLIGGSGDVAYTNAEADVAAINTVPIFYANNPVGHGGTWGQVNGGEFGRVALGWLKWQLKGDTTAQKMFAGPDCELCKPPSKWTVKKKMLD